MKLPEPLEKIVKQIHGLNGKSLLVGGAVIDSLQERELKDWDIEVHNLNFTKLQELLSDYNKPKLVGKEFGIVKIDIDGTDYDFSIPRKENKIGLKHTDFSVELIPDMTPAEAALRRDLTINSMYIDLHSGETHDPYNGRADLEAGIIRHTSDKFVEDPLRVLRIMQILPRKGKTVAPETMELCKSLVDQHDSISRERIFEEWNKLLMRAQKPSIGLRFLEDCGWIVHYPELNALRTTEQNPEWHPEGNCWNHTLNVVDAGAQLKHKVAEDWQQAYMYGLLLHDVGKAITTSEDLTAYGHAKEGVAIAENFLKRIDNEVRLNERMTAIVKNHMGPTQLYSSKSGKGGWKRLHNKIRLDVIAYVSLADFLGRGGKGEHGPSKTALEQFKEYGKVKITPVLMGRHLIEKGLEPGPGFKKLLDTAYEIQLDEEIKDPALLYERVMQE